MIRPDERDPERDVDRPRRCSHLPSYIQDYEVSYPTRHHIPVDEEARQTTPSDVFRCIGSIRVENDLMRQDVQRLTDMISSSPVLASQYAMSWPRCHEEEMSSTHASTHKLMPLSGRQDPRQSEGAPQVPFGDESLHPQGSQLDPMEELSDSLKGAGLSSQHAAH